MLGATGLAELTSSKAKLQEAHEGIAPLPGDLNPLLRQSLPEETPTLASFLIGKTLVRRIDGDLATCRIVETEAYLAHDAASHSYRGRTARNATMFGERGFAYVYLAYGTSYMLNVSSGADGTGEGVLIRAAEPLSGLDAMSKRRGGVPLRDLMRGPGRLAQALGIDRSLDGSDLCRAGTIWLASGSCATYPIGVSVRIGISKDADLPLRFFERGSPFVSGSATLNGFAVPRSQGIAGQGTKA